MRTYQHTAFTVLEKHDIFYGGHKVDAGVDFQIDMNFASSQLCETYSKKNCTIPLCIRYYRRLWRL